MHVATKQFTCSNKTSKLDSFTQGDIEVYVMTIYHIKNKCNHVLLYLHFGNKNKKKKTTKTLPFECQYLVGQQCIFNPMCVAMISLPHLAAATGIDLV